MNMNLNKKAIEYFPNKAKKSTKRILGISAHQDDLEIFGFYGINKAINEDFSFVGVVTSDGRNSPRTGEYANFTDKMMIEARIKEQEEASEIGHYEAQYLLGYQSSEIQQKENDSIVNDFVELIKFYKPEIILTHNLCDKHPTHVGTVIKVIKALRQLDDEYMPKLILGCEVWRDLDWLNDKYKVILDCGEDAELQKDLLTVFKSQVVGGKRYDLATVGRRYSNATFSASHGVDNYKMTNYAMDLTPLIKDKKLSIADFLEFYLDDFKKEVLDLIKNID